MSTIDDKSLAEMRVARQLIRKLYGHEIEFHVTGLMAKLVEDIEDICRDEPHLDRGEILSAYVKTVELLDMISTQCIDRKFPSK